MGGAIASCVLALINVVILYSGLPELFSLIFGGSLLLAQITIAYAALHGAYHESE